TVAGASDLDRTNSCESAETTWPSTARNCAACAIDTITATGTDSPTHRVGKILAADQSGEYAHIISKRGADPGIGADPDTTTGHGPTLGEPNTTTEY
ncbi:MAG: hypothetical protein ACRCZF_07690, partial [Gemmataceae bacterium]